MIDHDFASGASSDVSARTFILVAKKEQKK